MEHMIEKMDDMINTLSGLEVDSAGIRTSGDHNRLTKSRTLPDFAVVFLTGGRGSLETGESAPLEVREGEGFLLFPGVPHLYGPDRGTRWREIWVLFRGPFAQGLLDGGLMSPCRPRLRPPEHRRRRVEEELRRIAELLRLRPFEYRLDAVPALYRLLLLLLLPAAPGPRGAEGRNLELEIRDLLDSRLSSGEKISGWFRTPELSYNSLRVECRRLFGMPPAALLARMRMEKAKELLIWTGLPVGRVARETGFDDPYHFSRTFRRQTGASPRAFRKSYLAGDV